MKASSPAAVGYGVYLFAAAGPLAAFLVYIFFPNHAKHTNAALTAAMAAWMGIWWLTEVVPLGVTSLLPLAAFPLLGVMKAGDVAGQYTNDVVFLFLGGFLVALAMEKWGLHRRLALRILLLVGGGPRRTLLGFMTATAVLSMWISNTATTMMMIPIAVAVLSRFDEMLVENQAKSFSIALLLGIAYSASIGGIATLVGTPPNLVFVRQFQINFPDVPEITFASWFFFAFPLTIALFVITWLLLGFMFIPRQRKVLSSELYVKELKQLGPMRSEEKSILVIFLALAVLWVTRKPLVLGTFTIPGWSVLFPVPGFIGDGTVAISLATLLFLLPAERGEERILDGGVFARLPWGIVLLFGGGFALAKAFSVSGLSALIGTSVQGLSSMPSLLLTATISTLMSLLTELTSNTATTQMALPILAAISVAIQHNPLLLMVPATIAASCAFMMPVATPPNAIVFGTGRLRILDMVKAGVFLNFIAVTLITLWIHLVGPPG